MRHSEYLTHTIRQDTGEELTLTIKYYSMNDWVFEEGYVTSADGRTVIQIGKILYEHLDIISFLEGVDWEEKRQAKRQRA